MTINCSLGGFAAHMLAAGADMKLAEEAVLEKACVMVEKEAKDVIGTYRYDWPQRRSNGRASGTRPMSRCCAMERCGPSISHVVVPHEHAGYVGSTSKIAAYQELGTGRFRLARFLLPLRCMRSLSVASGSAFSRKWRPPVPSLTSFPSTAAMSRRTAAGSKRGESRKRLAVLAAEERANVADDRVRPVAFALTPGNVADIAMAAGTVDRPQIRWGLIPFWAKDGKGGARMINAQSETCGIKAAFREEDHAAAS
jgi:hypothetical protein